MKAWLKIFIVLAIYFLHGGASANDSVARVRAGGLVLEKTDDIEMVSEVLEISTSKIRVAYHFLNTSDKDIKTTVAFPMPAFGGRPDRDSNERPMDFFRVLVSDKNVPLNISRAFLINKADVTDKFRKIGLSDAQIFDPRFRCTQGYLYSDDNNRCHISAEQVRAIKKLDADGDWQIQETAYWEQMFPAGKDIEVVHEYKPFVGYNPDGHLPGFVEKTDGCLDGKTSNAIAKKLRELDDVKVLLEDVEYILGTGRNWKGPIKNFKLIIKKESPDDIVSLCFPGKPQKPNPLIIEFSQKDYVPQDKLLVLFYYVGGFRVSEHEKFINK